jgi:hypothetical protein
MRLAGCGAPVAVKRRAVDPVNKVNVLPIIVIIELSPNFDAK